jgi:hypothetical protein
MKITKADLSRLLERLDGDGVGPRAAVEVQRSTTGLVVTVVEGSSVRRLYIKRESRAAA